MVRLEEAILLPVETFVATVTLKAIGPSVVTFSVAGAAVQVELAGAPVQVSATAPVKPPLLNNDRLKLAVPPAVTVALVEPPAASPMDRSELPTPVRLTVCGVFPESSFTESVPVRVPEAVGVNVTKILHRPWAPKVVPHVLVTA